MSKYACKIGKNLSFKLFIFDKIGLYVTNLRESVLETLLRGFRALPREI